MVTRTHVCTKSYLFADGSESSRLPQTSDILCVGVKFTFDNGEIRVQKWDEWTPVIQSFNAASGIAHTGGDTYAAAKGDPARGVELFLARMELLDSGLWSEKGSKGETSPAQLVEAIGRALIAAGRDFSDEKLAEVKESVKDADYREAAKNRADVSSHLIQIRLEAMQKRAEVLAEKAEEAGEDEATSLDDL